MHTVDDMYIVDMYKYDNINAESPKCSFLDGVCSHVLYWLRVYLEKHRLGGTLRSVSIYLPTSCNCIFSGTNQVYSYLTAECPVEEYSIYLFSGIDHCCYD